MAIAAAVAPFTWVPWFRLLCLKVASRIAAVSVPRHISTLPVRPGSCGSLVFIPNTHRVVDCYRHLHASSPPFALADPQSLLVYSRFKADRQQKIL